MHYGYDMTRECEAATCERPARGRGAFCEMHRQRLQRSGGLDAQPRVATVEERLLAYSDRSGECWIWTGGKTGAGYGAVSLPGRSKGFAHRLSYEATVGPIPDGAWIDHLCRTPACIRPEHLRAVPPGENTRAGLLGFGLTGRCRAGLHDMSDEANIYTYPDGRRRRCRPCRDARAQEGYARRRGITRAKCPRRAAPVR